MTTRVDVWHDDAHRDALVPDTYALIIPRDSAIPDRIQLDHTSPDIPTQLLINQ
jgi:hypothetical protein